MGIRSTSVLWFARTFLECVLLPSSHVEGAAGRWDVQHQQPIAECDHCLPPLTVFLGDKHVFPWSCWNDGESRNIALRRLALRQESSFYEN